MNIIDNNTKGIVYNSENKQYVSGIHIKDRWDIQLCFCSNPDNALLLDYIIYLKLAGSVAVSNLHFRPHNPVNTESSK